MLAKVATIRDRLLKIRNIPQGQVRSYFVRLNIAIMSTSTNIEKIILQLRGMSCASCASKVEKAISNVPGVESCNVNFGAQLATINYNPATTSLENIQNAVTGQDTLLTR